MTDLVWCEFIASAGQKLLYSCEKGPKFRVFTVVPFIVVCNGGHDSLVSENSQELKTFERIQKLFTPVLLGRVISLYEVLPTN